MFDLKLSINGYALRIDELDHLITPEVVSTYVKVAADGDWTPSPEFCKFLFEPLGLPAGTYTIKGIEGAGPYYKGPTEVGDPFELAINSSHGLLDLMLLCWRHTQQHGWPDVDHVWFETLTVDLPNKVLEFSMGS